MYAVAPEKANDMATLSLSPYVTCLCMDMHRRQRFLATASGDRSVRVFTIDRTPNGAELELKHTLRDNVARVPWNGIVWNKDGSYIVGGTVMSFRLQDLLSLLKTMLCRIGPQGLSYYLYLGSRYRKAGKNSRRPARATRRFARMYPALRTQSLFDAIMNLTRCWCL